jgi:hypothetical protein
MRDAAAVGRRVIEAFDRGRAIAIEQKQRRAAVVRDMVAREAELDARAGRPPRGRARRIARRLSAVASERSVYRQFAALFSAANSSS